MSQPVARSEPTPAENTESQDKLPILIGQVYDSAPPGLRASMLEHLLRPLGVLALVVIANGIFAKIRFRSGWPELHVRLEDASTVQGADVAALAERVQQHGVEVLGSLARLISTSPVMASSAAATLLVALLVQRNGLRRHNDLS